MGLVDFRSVFAGAFGHLLQRRPAAAQWPGELPADVEAMAPRRWREDVRAARSAALALYSCAGSRRNRMLMRKDGVVPLLARLIKSDKAQLLVPIVGILNHFAKEVNRHSCVGFDIVYNKNYSTVALVLPISTVVSGVV